jgi:hypothetical protein
MTESIRTDLPLEIRAKHLASALRDYRNAETSLRLVENGDDMTGLQGTIDEVTYAINFYCYESKEICSSFSSLEIETLKKNGSLTAENLMQLAEMPDRDAPLEPTESKKSDKEKIIPHSPSNS